MTNSNSRKVIKKEISQLLFYVGNADEKALKTNGEAKYFNLVTLFDEFAKGLEKWVETFNSKRDKFEIFVERYDSIISDSRYRKTYFS